MLRSLALAASAALLSLACAVAWSQPAPAAADAAIRKSLKERAPDLPAPDEISLSPIPGLFEVRVAGEIFYTDADASYVLHGDLIDTKARRNLTEQRLNVASAFDFAKLPLKDAIVWKKGGGERKLVVFADPNCGYCKRFEAALQKVDNVTVYTFLYPILGGDSPEKAKAIWCAKDRTSAWRNWMIDAAPPPRPLGDCATPMERNLELGRQHRVTGTPAIVFEDNTRVPGAMDAAAIEKQLQASSKKKG
ncbi:MAG TPA: DsbC family protein [Burkholderiaceae bacterium]|jgi:thiol:disulfide interchange protein DsbC|nr:DsbC family protein [Burkholderiaceae bacterium]